MKQEKKGWSAKDIIEADLLTNPKTTFHYFPDKIDVFFGKNLLHLKKYSLKYEDIGQWINPNFINTSKYVKGPTNIANTTNLKRIALTFDDGPDEKTTPKILATLKKEKIPATFFVLGKQAEKNPKLIKQINREGHELGNHSYDHPQLTTLSDKQVKEQINQTQLAVYQAAKVLPSYVRPPYGSYNKHTASTIGLPILLWDIDSEDWKSKDSKKIQLRIKNTIENQGILLCHDIQPATVEALPNFIKELKADGYEFTTISALLNEPAQPMTAYFSANDYRLIQ